MIALLLCLAAVGQDAEVKGYHGQWIDDGHKLDGEMTAGVLEGKTKRRARFTGVFDGVPFDHQVDFGGSADKLVGAATINGAKYLWQGTITAEVFKATFTSNRGHRGTFELKRVQNE